jgi:hypothetical protein
MDFDVSAIADLRNRRRVTKGASVADRRAAEKPELSPTDGRRLRRTGRDVPVNFKVRPEWKQRLYNLAEAQGVAMVEILERALDAYERETSRTKTP